jgi:hypothetical protein
MKILYRLLLFYLLGLGNVYAQSALPACTLGDEKKISNCWGRFVYGLGTVWVGELKGGIPNGEGILYSNGGKVLESGILNGTSLISSYKIDPSRYPYEILGGGYAKSNLPACPTSGYLQNCFGTYTFPSGERYVGEFKNDLRHGQGTFYTSSGVVVSEGLWSDGRLIRPAPVQHINSPNHAAISSTQTTITQSNLPACPVTGFFDNCFGTVTLRSGEKYVGEFKNNLRHGQGIFYASNGLVVSEGLWADGKFLRSASIQQASQPNSEVARLRAEAEESKRKQNELEEQLKLALQRPITTPSVISSDLGKRIALVVGNANYKVRPLKNPRNDADDVSRSLKATGFEVIDLRDATLPQMRTAVRQFGDRLVNNDVGLVYYSGHGVEVKGRNYFIPVNADIQREDEIADQGLDVALILEKMSTAGKGVNILIVDACRDDPFGRSFRSSSRGLAQMDAPRGTIIAYATSPGKVASDGDPRERNSPYTKHLVKAMQSPNKPIEQVFKEVRRAVQDETKNQQTPWENTSLSGDFFFRVQR